MTVTAQPQYQTYVFTGEKKAGNFFHTITRELDFPKRLEDALKQAREEVKSENFTKVNTIADLLVVLNTLDFNKKANQQLLFKLLEDHELVRKYFVSNVLKADIEITEAPAKFEVTAWTAVRKITPEERISYVDTKVKQIVTTLTKKFLDHKDKNGKETAGNPFIGQALFEKCPETVKLLSPKVLAELAEKNTGMAFVIFEDAELRSKVIDYLGKEYTSQKIAVYFGKLLAKMPERIGQHWQDYFHRIFKCGLENFPTEISYLLELGSGVSLKKIYEDRPKDEQATIQAIYDELIALNLGLLRTQEYRNKKVEDKTPRIRRVFFKEARAELLELTKVAELKNNKRFKAPYFIAMREIQDNLENFKEYFGNTYYGSDVKRNSSLRNPSKELLYFLNWGKEKTNETYQQLYQELTTKSLRYRIVTKLVSWSWGTNSLLKFFGQVFTKIWNREDYLLKQAQHEYIQKQLAKSSKEAAAPVLPVESDNKLSETSSIEDAAEFVAKPNDVLPLVSVENLPLLDSSDDADLSSLFGDFEDEAPQLAAPEQLEKNEGIQVKVDPVTPVKPFVPTSQLAFSTPTGNGTSTTTSQLTFFSPTGGTVMPTSQLPFYSPTEPQVTAHHIGEMAATHLTNDEAVVLQKALQSITAKKGAAKQARVEELSDDKTPPKNETTSSRTFWSPSQSPQDISANLDHKDDSTARILFIDEDDVVPQQFAGGSTTSVNNAQTTELTV